jgi:hypothetical protein
LALGLASFMAGSAAAQAPSQPDPLVKEVDELLKQAQAEIDAFENRGRKKSDPEHPVVTWVEKLWAFREVHPATAGAGKATTEAIHLLVHAERVPEAERRADSVAADDSAWESLSRVVVEGAASGNDYAFAARKLSEVAARQDDAKVRSRVNHYLGRALWKSEKLDDARAAYQAALRDAAGTAFAKDVETALYEMDNLGYGQPAPSFAATARDGSRVALADFHGRVVILVFWAST